MVAKSQQAILIFAIIFLIIAIIFGILFGIALNNTRNENSAGLVFASIAWVSVFAPIFGVSLLISLILFVVYAYKVNKSK
jgi:uncharacterized membrane protein